MANPYKEPSSKTIDKLETYYGLSVGSPVCPLSGEPAVWSQLHRSSTDTSFANYVPLSKKLATEWERGAESREFSLDHLSALYQRHLLLARANLGYACARIAVQCLRGRVSPGEHLTEAVEWVKRAVHALRHSLRAELLRHTLLHDLVSKKQEHMRLPFSAHRLAMELAALLNEHGIHAKAREFHELAGRFVELRDLEHIAIETGSFFEPLDYHRRLGQVLLHQNPHDSEWRYHLDGAADFVTPGNASFPIVEANLVAFGSFHNRERSNEAILRYEALKSKYLPRLVSIADFKLENVPDVTNAAAKAELLLFSGVALAAAKAGKDVVMAHLGLADKLFHKTCNHKLSKFYWEGILGVEVEDSEIRSHLHVMSTRWVREELLDDDALAAIDLARAWLDKRRPSETKYFISLGGFMQITNPVSKDHSIQIFNELNSYQQSQLGEILGMLNELRRVQPVLPVGPSEHETLERNLIESEEQIKTGNPDKTVLRRCFEGMQQIVQSIPAGVAGNAAFAALTTPDDLLNKLHHVLQMLSAGSL